jgi:class 3 adenylate cyclase
MSTANLTFLFTDIADSTELALALGDATWDRLLCAYRFMVRRHLDRFGGFEVDTAGDGFFAVFQTTDCAVRCARSLASESTRLGVASRTAIHRGTCETAGEKPTGVNLHVAARIMMCAQPGEVLVSESARDGARLVGLAEAGSHALRGLPGQWPLFRAA